MSRVIFLKCRVAVVILALFIAPSVHAGSCVGIGKSVLGVLAGYESLSSIENVKVAEAVQKLPIDERAWARQAKVRWNSLLAQVAEADTPIKREHATQALAAFEHELAVVGKARIDAAVGSIAHDENAVVFAFPEEPTAYKLLAMSWEPTTPKNIHIKGKTAAQGIAKGFVPVDQSLSKAATSPESLAKYQKEVDLCLTRHEATAVPLKQANLNAVIRDGKPIWVSEVRPTDHVVKILADSRGRPFVSDLDLLAIATRTTGPDPLVRDPLVVHEYGDVTEVDHQIIRKINRKFQTLDGTDTQNHEQKRSLVQHGAANRFTASPKLGESNFPMTVYFPDGRIEQVADEAELKIMLAAVRADGYVVSENPRWGWSGN